MKQLLILFFAVHFTFLPARAQYDLAETLGAPYATSIYASHDGQSLAWVTNEMGVRNIWYTDVNDLSPRQITPFDQDDGQGLSNLLISQGFVFYVRGSNPNRHGEIANPASLPQAPKRQIWRLSLSDNQTDVVATAANPRLSPDGHQLIYSISNQVYLVEDIAADVLKPRSLFAVRRGVRDLNWSPDGTAVAFVSNRSDHSFVGVYTITENKIKWMAPSLYTDTNPAWSPDGNNLAFIRFPGRNKDGLNNLMGGRPFEIVVANVATAKGVSIWQSPADDGGFSQYYPNEPLRWTKGNQILFYSEHEGWNHIYSIQPDGSGIKDLTPGLCETENNDLSKDHRWLYVTTNCDDLNRRHIWKVEIATGKSKMVTNRSSIQTHPRALAGENLAYREGQYNEPTGVVIQKDQQTHDLVELPATFPKKDLVVPEAVQFQSADGLTIHGQLFLPANHSPGQLYPAVIFMHGGPIRQMLLGYHYSQYYANAYILNQYLTTQGYAVLAVNFRDGIGYGRDFRRAENQGPRGASEYQDILAAGKYLRSRSEVDREKIGLWGGSYGGYLTAMGLAKNSDLFKAGVDLHGVHDWAWRARDFSSGGGWGISSELMNMAYHSSPISELRFWSSPVLIIHGDDDRNVMFGQSIDLKNKLDALGVHNEILVFPDEVHGFLRYDSWLRAYEATVDFFDRFLK